MPWQHKLREIGVPPRELLKARITISLMSRGLLCRTVSTQISIRYGGKRTAKDQGKVGFMTRANAKCANDSFEL